MKYLLAAAVLVLLIGCANLANMLLTRTQRREREYGVRAALGARGIRLIRAVIFESVIIGLAGAGLALVVTSAAFDALLPHVPAGAYGNAPVGVSERVVALTFALGLVGGLSFAVAPAWRSARLDALALIRGRSVAGNTSGVRSPMVAAKVACRSYWYSGR
jgi:ABC-type antimicrobial peptide transport system permease subunit